MLLYLDNCAIQRPLDDQTQVRIRAEAEAVIGILALCESGQVELIASGVHVIENRRCPYPDRRAHVDDVLSLAAQYASSSGMDVLTRAEAYQAVGIKRFDALHLASSAESGADYFCTTDDELLRKGKKTETGKTSVVSPLELVVLLR